MAVTLALLVALAAGRVRAEQISTELTLEQVLAMARRANRSLVAERERLAQAQTSIEQAWASLLPTIALQGRYTRNYKEFLFALGGGPLLIQPINQLDGIASFSMPLLVPAAYLGLEAVKTGVGSSEANFQASEDAVLFAVAQTFYTAAISDDVVAARHSSIDVTRATLQNAQTRYAAGTVTKVDVDRAELAVVRAEQLEREARQGQEQAYRALGTLIQARGPLKVRAPPASPAPLPSQDVETALHLRPEFRALELSAQSADASRRAQGWRWAPSLSAFGNARKFNYDNFIRDRYSWAVGAVLDWVLYDGGNRDALRHLAAAQAAEAQARAEVFRDNVRDDLANNRSLLETKQHALDTAARSVELAKETLDLVRTQYEAGSATQVDLLQAQDNLVASQLALAQARFDVAIADLALRRAAGTFPGK